MKKVARRCLSLLLAVTLVITAIQYVPSEAADATYTSGDYEYTLNEDNEATITKYNGSAANLTIPDTLGGNAVVGIGNSVFKDRKTLLSVKIPDTVTSIGSRAFAYTSLTSLDLPSQLKSIGSFMLDGVKGVTKITIPKSVETME